MIVGVGTDICQVDRIAHSLARFGERFARRVLHETEWQDWLAQSDAARARFLARRFAAKEAAVKALGTGAGRGVALSQVRVDHDALGKPLLEFCGEARSVQQSLQAGRTHLSISDERDYAIALVVLER